MNLQSLYLVLQSKLPDYLTFEIQSYLDLKTLSKWRLVNKQAFIDVETHVHNSVMGLERKGFVNFFSIAQDITRRRVEEPTYGLSVLPFGSLWYHFHCDLYECKQCKDYQPYKTKYPNLNYDYNEAEMKQLCGACFVQGDRVHQCSLCHIHQEMWENNTCAQCHGFWCDDCSEDVIEMCFECTELYCDSCRLGDTCINC